MDSLWLVLLCRSCERAFGRQSSSKDTTCPHCNHTDAKVLSRHHSAGEASKAVSAANTPPEIREQLSTWMDQQSNSTHSTEKSPIDGNHILSKSEDEEGYVTLESLRKVLVSSNIPIDAESFAEHACSEGQLMRAGVNRWKRP